MMQYNMLVYNGFGAGAISRHATQKAWLTKMRGKKMIDEYWTWQFYGYYSDDLAPKSHKPIVARCDGCCKYRIVEKSSYRNLCISCSSIGKRKITNQHKIPSCPREDNRKTKHLHSITNEGIQTRTVCVVDTKTWNIGVYSSHRLNNNWNGGASTNPKCSHYLGISVAEQLLAKVFKNVEQMPTNNPGYDFICNHGKKIDVKASCTNISGKYRRWKFHIEKNVAADYFLCIAFDDRENLVPLHVWLLPSSLVAHLRAISISPSTLIKWAKYELVDKLGEVVKRCNNMRNATTQ